jgi:hypothetical protein
MRCPYTVHLRVLRDGELFVSRVLRGAPVVLGPSSDATIPTSALEGALSLLVPQPGGFGLRLAPPLDGQLIVGTRTLGIRNGLLVDPRPEPLLLTDGAEGQIELEPGISLHFTVHRVRQTFRRWARPDLGLCAALGLAAVLVGALVLYMAPWQHSPKGVRERLLTRQSGVVLRLARVRPQRPQPAASREAAVQRTAPLPPRPRQRRPRRRRETPVLERGALGLLAKARQRHPQLLGQGEDNNRLLSQLERAFASTAASPAGAMRPGPSQDPLAGLLTDAAPVGDPGAVRLASPVDHRRRAQAPEKVGPNKRGPSREAIRKVVLQHSSQIRLCYEREMLRASRPMEGRLVLRWLIGAGGKVVGLEVVKDTVGSEPLKACVARWIRGWIFPQCNLPGGCAVVYPFDFYPSNGGQS